MVNALKSFFGLYILFALIMLFWKMLFPTHMTIEQYTNCIKDHLQQHTLTDTACED